MVQESVDQAVVKTGFVQACAYGPCSGFVKQSRAKVVHTSTGLEFYHPGCYLGMCLKETRQTIRMIQPNALAMQMINTLRKNGRKTAPMNTEEH